MSITRLQQARQMYALGKLVERVGFRGGGGQIGGTADMSGGSSNNTGGEGGNRPTMADIAGPITSSFTDADDNRQNYKTDQYTTGPTTTDPDKTTIDELTTTFAPPDKKPGGFLEGIKTIGKNLFKGYVALQTFGALGLSPKAVQIGNVALGFGKQTGLTKSGSISELSINALSGVGNLFSGNTNTGMNTNSFSGNTNSLSNNNQTNDREGGQGNADQGGVLSNEYILLLQKMQLGNFTQEEQTRFNLLKTMLGK